MRIMFSAADLEELAKEEAGEINRMSEHDELVCRWIVEPAGQSSLVELEVLIVRKAKP
jgi:hypothetical protein